jgi:hypothetical protein
MVRAQLGYAVKNVAARSAPDFDDLADLVDEGNVLRGSRENTLREVANDAALALLGEHDGGARVNE